MAAGAIGVHSLNALSHVVEAGRHVNGNVTAQALNMEGNLVRGMGMRHNPAILTYAQVGRNSSFVFLHIAILNLYYNICMYSAYIVLHTSFRNTKESLSKYYELYIN